MIRLPDNSDRLLSRQINKSFPDGNYTEEGFQKFVSLVNDAYISNEENRKLFSSVERIANKELEEVNKELQLKNDFLDTFNHGMAHDIKNHTSNIIGLVSMLKKYHARKDEKMIDTIIEKMDTSANQLTAIVQGFLYLSRAEANIDNQFVVINEDEIIIHKEETITYKDPDFLKYCAECDIEKIGVHLFWTQNKIQQ